MPGMRPRPDVALLPLGLEHAARMNVWMADPEIRDNVGVRAEPSLERTEAWIRAALADESRRAFAIVAGGEHAGNVVLDSIDTHLGTARLSIFVGAAARGAGVGATATRLAVEHAFQALGLHKVWLIVHSENTRARATYERIGFRLEGVLRGEFLLAGRRVDALRMGLLAVDLLP